MFDNVKSNHPYYSLVKVFNDAFLQASNGKGNERHAYSDREPYSDQVLCEMDKRLGGNAIGPRYRAVKKIYESARMEPDRAIHEILGAINYLAAAVIILTDKLSVANSSTAIQTNNIDDNIHNLIDDNFGIEEKKNLDGSDARIG